MQFNNYTIQIFTKKIKMINPLKNRLIFSMEFYFKNVQI